MRRRPKWRRFLSGLMISALLAAVAAVTTAHAAPPVSPAALAALLPIGTAPPAKPAGKREQQRKAVEALLDRDVEWNVGDKRTVTLEDFIAHVREKHGLAIRWDLATFQTLGGSGDSGSTGSHPPMLGVPMLGVSASSAAPLALPAATSPAPSDASPAPTATPGPAPGDEPRVSPTYSPAAGSPVTPLSPLPTALPASPAVAPSVGVVQATADPQPVDPVGDAKPDASAAEKRAAAAEDEAGDETELYEEFARRPVPLAGLALEGATVGEALRQLLDAASPPMTDLAELGLPLGTQALSLDYLIEGRAVVITTRMQANFRKETRVYPIGHLKSLPPDDLARVVVHSVRPWSWRSAAPEIAARLAARWPKGGKLTIPSIDFDVTSGVQLTSDASTGEPAAGDAALPKVSTPAESIDADTLASLGQFLASGVVAAWETGLAAVEMLYHGEPPTASIEVLPGVLIINQSQSAHREIEDLLEQLSGASAGAAGSGITTH